VHGLVALFLEVIVLGIILLVVGLVVSCVLVIASTMIMASIILMTIIRSAIIVITSVPLMVVAIFVATVLLVARFMATHGRNMSRILFLWLLLVLGNLLKNASCLVGHLTLLKEGIILSGLAGTILFKSANLFWCALGCAKKICSLFSCAVGTSIV
jgi:hypothetical protein